MTGRSANPPARFLQTLGNLLTTVSLYPTDHPAREAAVDASFEELQALLSETDTALFTFLEEKVVFAREPLRGLGSWPWSKRLSDVGVQRLELSRGVEVEELETFAAGLAARLGLAGAGKTEARGEAVREGGAAYGDEGAAEVAGEAHPPVALHPHIRYGHVGVRGAGEPAPGEAAAAPPLELEEEARAVEWLHEVAAEREEVPAAESAAVVGALLVAVRSARGLVAPLLQIKATDQYTTSHCVNVSILSMSLAEYLRLGDADVMAIGEAGLLHDIGKTRIPLEILNKPGKLTPRERAVVEHHVVEGARILLRSGDRSVLAAVVACEHHMHWDGRGGYPKPRLRHRPHRFSRLVQVCDVFDALRTRRPFRPPFATEAAMEFLRRRAGSEFDPEMVKAFLTMMRQWDPETVATDAEEEAAEVGGPEAVEKLVERSEAGFDADMEGELYGG